MAEDNFHYITSFNTKLTPEEEQQFQSWVQQESARTGRDKYRDLEDYDLKGAWKELQKGTMTEDERGHLGDKYKKPNHPTFSDQSIYHNTKDPKTGVKYEGGTWSKEDDKDAYTPSKHVLKMHGPEKLSDYFNDVEPGVMLKLPTK
jgi:hypothetical protein